MYVQRRGSTTATMPAFSVLTKVFPAGLKALSDIARLDTCVTVIDSANFKSNWNSVETVADREEERQVVTRCHTCSAVCASNAHFHCFQS